MDKVHLDGNIDGTDGDLNLKIQEGGEVQLKYFCFNICKYIILELYLYLFQYLGFILLVFLIL